MRQIPPSSGFANTSAASPFTAIASKSTTAKDAGKAESIPQTSDDKFKSSGFSGFASSAASPFSGFGSTAASSSSPFAAASGSKLSSFSGSKSPVGEASGFGALGNSSKPTLGGPAFGSCVGFAGLASAPKGNGLSSFAATGSLEIKGLKAKSDKPFGAAAVGESSDDEEGDESDGEKETKKEERQSSQPLLSQQRMSPTIRAEYQLTCTQRPRRAKKAKAPFGLAAQNFTPCQAREVVERGKNVAVVISNSMLQMKSRRRLGSYCAPMEPIDCC